MNHVARVTLILLLSAGLGACVVAVTDAEHGWDHDGWQETQRHNRETIARLELGSSIASVAGQLGSPESSEAYQRGEDRFAVYYYRTQHRKSDGKTTRDETTPVLFKNDRLVGWGDSVLAQFHAGLERAAF